MKIEEKNGYFYVRVDSDMKTKKGEVAISRKKNDEIRNWLSEEFKNHRMGIWLHDKFLKYRFNERDDAITFKLRWG